jgi:hypothetical protein
VNKKIAASAMTLAFVMLMFGFWNNYFLFAWVGWGLIFVTLELYTLSRAQKGDTLSEQVWLGTLSKSRPWSWFWIVSLAAFMSWLTTHLLLGL